MGVEPTVDASQAPTTGFEDRGRHRTTTIPAGIVRISRQVGKLGRGGVAICAENGHPFDCVCRYAPPGITA